MLTYQEWKQVSETNKPAAILEQIQAYKATKQYKRAVAAQTYFEMENEAIQKRLSIAEKYIPDMKSFKVANCDFPNMLTYWVFRTLGGGLNIDEEKKKKLGKDFDSRFLFEGIINAALGGICRAYYQIDKNGEDNNKLIYFPATQCFTLTDERTGDEKVLIRFWNANGDVNKALQVELFEIDGITNYSESKTDNKSILNQIDEKIPYQIKAKEYLNGDLVVTDTVSYTSLPIFKLQTNLNGKSELSDNRKAIIDAIDAITFELVDSILRDDGVYNYLRNYGGEDFKSALLLFQEKIISTEQDVNTDAESKSIEAPFAGKITTIEKLELMLKKSFSIPDESGDRGITATEIKDRNKYLDAQSQVLIEYSRRFICSIFDFIGIKHDDDEIQFDGIDVSNETEYLDNIINMLDAGMIDTEIAIQLTTLIPRDDKDELLERLAIKEQEEANKTFPLIKDKNDLNDEELIKEKM